MLRAAREQLRSLRQQIAQARAEYDVLHQQGNTLVKENMGLLAELGRINEQIEARKTLLAALPNAPSA